MASFRETCRSAIVVGSGAFGLSSAIELRARGADVTLVDPGPVPRPEAASTDISKIVRLDYGADRFYTELMEEALPRWREGVLAPLFHEVGFLLLSRTPLAAGSFEGDSLATLNARGHAVTRLDRHAIATRWPAWSAAPYVDGYFNEKGGWAESARVVARLAGEARGAGVRLLERASLSHLVEKGSRVTGVALWTGETLKADVVLVAAGAWTPVLLPYLYRAMWPVAQPVFHLKPARPDDWRAPGFTVWAADIARTGWYGFPANADGLVKIANHGPGRRVDPDEPRTTTPDDERSLRAFLAESLPALAGAPIAASKTCLYCDSFDGDFWIGCDPDRPGLAVAAGDSGHGFKFVPVLGAIVADAIEGKDTAATRRLGWRDIGARRGEDARFGLS